MIETLNFLHVNVVTSLLHTNYFPILVSIPTSHYTLLPNFTIKPQCMVVSCNLNVPKVPAVLKLKLHLLRESKGFTMACNCPIHGWRTTTQDLSNNSKVS
ncbi:hypothetical protein M758_9G012400 [Ceratodon purpureus]|nr:hypothetical protein M758_9G012400 [Ceratodon purpureus]